MAQPAGGQRLQKLLSQLGLASRRQAEAWIRAGRLSVNGRPAQLGMRVTEQDQLRLDGRLIRGRAAPAAADTTRVLLCHRSPGAPLAQLIERLPHRVGRRFVSVSPMPTPDGGLELISADGSLAMRLQRAVRALEVEFHLRVRGELSSAQQAAILEGRLDSGAKLRVVALEPSGGEATNRWYRLQALGASGSDARRLIERQAVTLVRVLRTRLGALALPPTLARGRWRTLSVAELSGLLGSPATDP